jgi:hypothetical protein
MKALVIPILIVATVLIAGCVGSETSLQLKDCGNDTECFAEASANCTPAKITTSPVNSGVTVIMYSSVHGGNLTACEYYMKYADIQLPSNASAMYVSQANLLRGKEITCVIPANPGGLLSGPSSLSSNAITTVCRGSLIDALMGSMYAAQAPTVTRVPELNRSDRLRNCKNDAMGCDESVRALNKTCAYEFCARSCVDAEGNDLFSGVPVTPETCVPETGTAEACAACRAGNVSVLE